LNIEYDMKVFTKSTEIIQQNKEIENTRGS
jgi:hypothetical protein